MILPAGLKQAHLRRLARRARLNGNWRAEANVRRIVCESHFALPRDWVQYGHTLKELGFFLEAENAYRRAQNSLPDSAEIALQLGHLLKVSGQLQSATESYERALTLGHSEKTAITTEIDRIRRAALCTIFSEKVGIDPSSGIHFYLSSPKRTFAEDDKESLSSGLGHSDYSYAFAMRGFVEALDLLSLPYTVLESPEFIVDIRDRSNAAINIHFAFYPPERMRLLKGAWNIACFAWEFERLRLSGESTSYHAFSDQGTMLGLVDEIWVPSSEGARAVAEGSSRLVRHVAAPVLSNHRQHARNPDMSWSSINHQAQNLNAVQWQPLAILPRIQGVMNNMAKERQKRLRSIVRSKGSDAVPRIFVTVLNVHDYRKQLRCLIEGFLSFSLEYPDAILLVKMTTPDRGKLTINEFLLMDQISNAGHLVPPMVSERIWITDNILTRKEMNALFDIADFYICTPYAEGQNLPLIEAMARGCVPVTPDHSAMHDYIKPDNAVAIPSTLEQAEPRITTRYGMWGIRTNVIAADAVFDALVEAVSLSRLDLANKSAAAMATVQDVFGIKPFEANVMDLQNRLTGAAA